MSAAPGQLASFLASAQVARAYTLTVFGVMFGAFAIEQLASAVTLITMQIGLTLVGLAILLARREELSLVRLAPTTLLLFLGWIGITMMLPAHGATSIANWFSMVATLIMAVTIAHTRDPLQSIRALGDVLRVLLAGSLIAEIVIGILLPTPLKILGIQGDIAFGGPVQGLFGTRNLLGLVAVVALITFVIELRTHSVPRGLAIASITVAVGLGVLSASPTALVVALGVGIATAALAVVRHTSPHRRRTVQAMIGSVLAVGLLTAFLLRNSIVAALGARSELSLRTRLWAAVMDYTRFRPWQGWGWRGGWDPSDSLAFPYTAINATGGNHASALNAYLDVLLQAGLVGLLLFLLMVGIALVRSWLVAGQRRSVLFAWTPLVLVTLLVNAAFESFALQGIGWLLLALCALRAGQSRSWRERMDADR